MRIRILDRVLVALAGLLMLAVCAAVIAQVFFQADVIGTATKVLTGDKYRIWLIIALAALMLIGLYCVLILFRHHGRRDKFVMQKTENGQLAISLKAMESMVQKCIETHKELNVQGVRLENQKGGLLIRIRGTAAGGVSIPLTVDALQQQIKQYVTACSGVEVKDIRVQIESSGPEATGSLYAIEPPTAKALPGAAGEEGEKAENGEANPAAGNSAETGADNGAENAPPQPSEAEGDMRQDELSAAAAAAELLKKEAGQVEDDRPMHQRLFSSPEEPCVMPMPPLELREAAKADTEPVETETPAEAGAAMAEPSVKMNEETHMATGAAMAEPSGKTEAETPAEEKAEKKAEESRDETVTKTEKEDGAAETGETEKAEAAASGEPETTAAEGSESK